MKRAAIVSPIRTGVGKYLGALSDLTAGELGDKAVDMTLRLDNAITLPTCPQLQQQQELVA